MVFLHTHTHTHSGTKDRRNLLILWNNIFPCQTPGTPGRVVVVVVVVLVLLGPSLAHAIDNNMYIGAADAKAEEWGPENDGKYAHVKRAVATNLTHSHIICTYRTERHADTTRRHLRKHATAEWHAAGMGGAFEMVASQGDCLRPGST